MVLKELKLRYFQGTIISFSETNHPKIPNTVLFDGAVVGTVTKSTIKAFRKFLKTQSPLRPFEK